MKIKEFYQRQRHTFSFEFFPPKTEDGEKKLFEAIRELKSLGPSFVSVTYGAMGTTRENTIRIVDHIKNGIGIETAAHLTCVGSEREEIETILEKLGSCKIENIVALRGDPPQGETAFRSPKNGFPYASELVCFIRRHPRYGSLFSIAVGGYPEGHVECRDKAQDLAHLKTKVDAGADVITTQLFFVNDFYFDFVSRARKIGIQIPIVPGIMPVTHGPQLQRFATLCGATVPKAIQDAIARYGDDQPSIEAFGIEYATRQCEELLRGGIPGLHFYTLNKSRATREIYKNLGLQQNG